MSDNPYASPESAPAPHPTGPESWKQPPSARTDLVSVLGWLWTSWPRLLALSMIVLLPVGPVQDWIVLQVPQAGIGVGLVLSFALLVLVTASVRTVIETERGAKPPILYLLKYGVTRCFVLIAPMITRGFFVLLGLILGVVPGLFLRARMNSLEALEVLGWSNEGGAYKVSKDLFEGQWLSQLVSFLLAGTPTWGLIALQGYLLSSSPWSGNLQTLVNVLMLLLVGWSTVFLALMGLARAMSSFWARDGSLPPCHWERAHVDPIENMVEEIEDVGDLLD